MKTKFGRKYDSKNPQDVADHDRDCAEFYAQREAEVTGSFWTDIPWYGRLALVFIAAWFASLILTYAFLA